MPILLNTGPSPRGVHRLEKALICPQLFAYTALLGMDLGSRDALVKGSLVHVGLAHRYARMQCVQTGTDPENYYPVETAMKLAAVEFGALGQEHLALTSQAVRNYEAHYSSEQVTVAGVEELVETNIRGHRLTARWDLITQDSRGNYWIIDHKTCGKIDQKTITRYTMSIQFLAMQHMGREKYGDRFGGVRINLVALQMVAFKRVSPEAAPHAVLSFPQIVEDAEAVIARNALRDPWDYPKAASEQVCVRPYGVCDAIELCRWGKP